jgi:hypothetical protein
MVTKTPFYAILRWDKQDDMPILFLPEMKANIDRMVCYSLIGRHSEASIGFYRFTKPYTKKQWNSDKGKAIRAQYLALMDKNEELVFVHKDRPSFRVKRYKWRD